MFYFCFNFFSPYFINLQQMNFYYSNMSSAFISLFHVHMSIFFVDFSSPIYETKVKKRKEKKGLKLSTNMMGVCPK